ncbi:MAG: MaoC family dehydratase [Chloroflexi bacterium]|nr:MaoC family dehydratase [Chloroflexota bacterium]
MSAITGWRGYFFDDFEAGQIIVHSGGRTLTETDNTWFTLLTCNTHPVHFNSDFAAKTEFGRCLMNSTLTLAVVAGMTVTDTSLNTVANLGWESINLPTPVFAGDTLYAETEILDKRESKSRPYAGIVKARTRGRNQNGVVVLEYVRSYMVYKKGQSPKDALEAERLRLAESGG